MVDSEHDKPPSSPPRDWSSMADPVYEPGQISGQAARKEEAELEHTSARDWIRGLNESHESARSNGSAVEGSAEES